MASKYSPTSWVVVIFSLILLLITSVAAMAELGQQSSLQSPTSGGQVRRFLQVPAAGPPAPPRNYNY